MDLSLQTMSNHAWKCAQQAFMVLIRNMWEDKQTDIMELEMAAVTVVLAVMK